MLQADKDFILQGSEHKLFDVYLQKLRKTYSDEYAKKLYELYSKMSRSFILGNIYDIMQEPKYGFEFCSKEFLPRAILFKYEYGTMLDCLENLIVNSRKFNVPMKQILIYKELLTKIEIMQSAITFEVGGYSKEHTISELILDKLYECERDHDVDGFGIALDALLWYTDPAEFFQVAPYILAKYPQSAAVICEKSRQFLRKIDQNTPANYVKDKVNAINLLAKYKDDKFVYQVLDRCGNVNLKNLWLDAMEKAPSAVDNERCAAANEVVQIGTVAPCVESVFESAIGYDFNHDTYEIRKYNSLDQKCGILNSFLESPDISEDAFEFYYQELCDTEAEMLALEWEDDGEPNDVVKRHIMTRKEMEKEEAEKEKEKQKKLKEKLAAKGEADTSSNIENSDARKKAVDDVKSVIHDNGDKDNINKSDIDSFVAGQSNSISLGYYDDAADLLPEIRDAVDSNFSIRKDDDEIIMIVKESSDLYCGEGVEVGIISNNLVTFMEEVSEKEKEEKKDVEDSEPKEDTPEPEKPHEDFATKVQNKALDHDAKRNQKKALKDERNTKLKNAAKASTAGVRSDIKRVEKFTHDFSKWDENRRKKFFLKPGYRHRIFKNFGLAVMYSSAAKAKLTLVPVLALLRHFSKDKDRRLRNELSRELDTEIRICEEKINDANSNGDQAEKYKLMRIKAKLESEKQRVAVNSKFI